MEKETEIERARRENAVAMAKRIEETDAYIRESYPMRPGNSCAEMSEAQFLAYIRKCQKEFEDRR